jgi:hypothetical protein
MRKLNSFKSRTKVLVAVLAMAMAAVGLGGDASAKTVSIKKPPTCYGAVTPYFNPVAYGCIGDNYRVDCVKGYNNCWLTTRRVFVGRGLGGMTVTRVRSLTAWADPVCDLCYENCQPWNYICRIHCQSRGGCPPPPKRTNY